MANEWQSLLQQAPNMANLNLVKTAQDAFGTAQDQKIKAYDQYRLQKAQEIASKATRPDGTMDWDAMYQEGAKAGIGLDTFNQVQKMQTDRRASEVSQLQNRMILESMGYNPSNWDRSAGDVTDQSFIDQYGRNAKPVPYVAPPAETKIPQAAPVVFGAQGVGETAQTSMPSSAPVQTAPQDVVPAANEVIITPNAIPSSGTFTLPERPTQPTEGYGNTLWRTQRDPEAMQRMLQGSAVGAIGPQLSVAQMSDAEKANLSRYLAMRGIADADPQQALTALENMAIQSVPQPVLNPMVGMMSKDDQAKEYGRYRQAIAEYPAKVQEAIAKVSDSIKSGNMDVVTQDLAKTASRIAQAGNERAQQEYARGRQAANQLVEMGVTAKPMPDADVKALQDVFIPAIADIKQARNGFGGAMQAAIAKSKVDGSLNFDAILANLTAMGAMPSDQAAKIKAKLTPEAYTAFGAMAKAGAVDAIKEGLRGLGFDVGVGTGATNALWETSALGNVFQQAQAHGMTKSYFDKQSKVTPWSQESPAEVLSRQPQATPARQTSPRQTQSGGYSETKINAAGMKMGRRKSDGKWEPVR